MLACLGLLLDHPSSQWGPEMAEFLLGELLLLYSNWSPFSCNI